MDFEHSNVRPSTDSSTYQFTRFWAQVPAWQGNRRTEVVGRASCNSDREEYDIKV